MYNWFSKFNNWYHTASDMEIKTWLDFVAATNWAKKCSENQTVWCEIKKVVTTGLGPFSLLPFSDVMLTKSVYGITLKLLSIDN